MKGMVLTKNDLIENSPLKLKSLDIKEPLEDEVLIRVSACGICHTDLHVIEGELPPRKLPIIPGHQIVGRVEEIGKNVKGLKAGNRVGVAWLYSSCGKCKYCLKEMENLCENPEFTGWTKDGGYAEYVISKESFTYKLPENFNDEECAPLLCAGIIGYRSFKLSNIREGENLGLYGFGASAHIVLQIAKFYGCNVFVFSRSQSHRELALELGAKWVGSSKDKPPEELDSAIIFAPVGNLYIYALKVLRKGGTVASAGIHMSPIPEFSYELLYNERIMRSVANSTREDAKELLSLASRIPLKTKIEIFPLVDANKALQALKRGEINGAGVIKIC
ncbi:MAG: zinc-dependent alcohol dehydrogenase family protein [Candidatus Aminicenantia bacterium]